ncbi:MAG: hypothetical protein AAF192_10315, partial [Pseudomonadota bacterium]
MSHSPTTLSLDRSTAACLLSTSAISGLMTYVGFDASFAVDTWIGEVALGFAALAVALGIHQFWRWAFRAVANFRRGAPLAAVAGPVALALPLIIGMSSWPNVAGLAGDQAIEIGFSRQIEDIAEAAGVRIEVGRAVDRFAPRVEQLAARYAEDALDECSGDGSRTGASGEGTVCFTLRAVAAELDALMRRQADTARAASAGAEAEVGALLERMRAVAAGGLEAHDKHAAISALLDQLRRALAGVDPARSFDVLRDAYAALPNIAGRYALTARSAASRARQQAAVDAIRDELQREADRMARDLDRAAPEAPEALPRIERLSPFGAVRNEAGQLAPFWAVGVSIDLLPLVILLFLAIQRASLSDEELVQNEVGERTVRDLMLDKAAAELLRAPVVDKSAVTRAVDAAMGRRALVE